MSESTFGNIFKVTTFGESHGPAIGAVIDKVPAGLSLSEEDFVPYMLARRPSADKTSTQRRESDTVHILSGVFNGKTTGTPISLIIYNEDSKSSDYEAIKDIYRPGHADFTYDVKYGFRDYRGGGRSSGRETATRVAAGVVARKILDLLNIKIDSAYSYPQTESADSVGGKVDICISNVPAGLGEPVFDKLDAVLSHALMSVGAVKAISFGDGLKAPDSTGLTFNDSFTAAGDIISTETNHSGGILGGISNGNDITLTCFIKPTPSTPLLQKTVNKDGQPVDLEIKGRHDKCIVPRVAPVLEAMCAITLADMLLLNMSSTAEGIIKYYK